MLYIKIHWWAKGQRSFAEHYDIVLFLKTSHRLPQHADYRVSHRKSLVPPFLRTAEQAAVRGGGVLFFFLPQKPYSIATALLLLSLRVRVRTSAFHRPGGGDGGEGDKSRGRNVKQHKDDDDGT